MDPTCRNPLTSGGAAGGGAGGGYYGGGGGSGGGGTFGGGGGGGGGGAGGSSFAASGIANSVLSSAVNAGTINNGNGEVTITWTASSTDAAPVAPVAGGIASATVLPALTPARIS
jgi:hypothetical protein